MKINLLLLLLLVAVNLSCSYFSTVPSNVVKFIKEADNVELITDAQKVNGKLEFAGDMIKRESLKANVDIASEKEDILSAFLADTAWGDGAACFTPLHLLRAKKGEQIVEIQICYACSRYEGSGSFGNFSGEIGFGSSKKVLEHLLLEKGQQQ